METCWDTGVEACMVGVPVEDELDAMPRRDASPMAGDLEPPAVLNNFCGPKLAGDPMVGER